MKNPRSLYCGESRIDCPVADRRRGYPHGLAELHQIGHIHRVEPGLCLREELIAFRSTQHDGDLMLTELGQPDHRTDIQPMLAGQAVDPDPPVGGAHDAQHRACLRIGRQPKIFQARRHQHRIRQCGQQGLEGRYVDLDHLILPRGRDAECGQRTERGVTARDVLRDAGAGLHRYPAELTSIHPSRCGLDGQRRRRLLTTRSVLAVVGDPNDDEIRVDLLQAVAIEPPLPTVGRAGQKILYQQIGLRDQLVDPSVVRGEIDCQSALSGVEIFEEAAAVRIRLATGKRPPPPQRIPRRWFDLVHVGAEVDEELRAIRGRDVTAELDHAQPGQWPRHVGTPIALGSI